MLNFEKICRTCMSESSALLNIYDDNSQHSNESIAGLLGSFTTILVSGGISVPSSGSVFPTPIYSDLFLMRLNTEQARQGDQLPANICLACVSEINRAVSFKQKCERSEYTLQTHVQQLQLVKHELLLDKEINAITDDSKNTIDGQFELTATKDDAATYDFIETTEPTEELLSDALITNEYDDDAVNNVDYDTMDDDFVVSATEENLPIGEPNAPTAYRNTDESIAMYCPPVITVLPSTIRPGSFQCDKCAGTFATKKSLSIHVRYNKCIEKSFECHICKRVFISRRTLTLHMPTHLAKRFSCDRCQRQFTRKERLKLHLNDHNNDHKHQCPHCPKGFNMIGTLKDHLRTHNGERPYLCSICGKGFSQSTNLRQHMMRHSQTKPHKCTVCPNTFVSKGELSAHMRKHTGDHPFVCDLCGSGFTTSSSMVKHRRIHTGERPYACDFCPMRFTALGTLKNHRRTHTGERPFACNYCDRRFAQRSDCMSHQRIHTEERKYVCITCGKLFQSRSTLKQHVAKLHPSAKEAIAVDGSTESQSCK